MSAIFWKLPNFTLKVTVSRFIGIHRCSILLLSSTERLSEPPTVFRCCLTSCTFPRKRDLLEFWIKPTRTTLAGRVDSVAAVNWYAWKSKLWLSAICWHSAETWSSSSLEDRFLNTVHGNTCTILAPNVPWMFPVKYFIDPVALSSRDEVQNRLDPVQILLHFVIKRGRRTTNYYLRVGDIESQKGRVSS